MGGKGRCVSYEGAGHASCEHCASLPPVTPTTAPCWQARSQLAAEALAALAAAGGWAGQAGWAGPAAGWAARAAAAGLAAAREAWEACRGGGGAGPRAKSCTFAT